MSASQQHGETAAAAAAKLAVPASVTSATLAGVQIEHLVLWATLIYTVLMIVHKMWSMWREWRKAQREDEDVDASE